MPDRIKPRSRAFLILALLTEMTGCRRSGQERLGASNPGAQPSATPPSPTAPPPENTVTPLPTLMPTSTVRPIEKEPYTIPFGEGVLIYHSDGAVVYTGPMGNAERVTIHSANPTWITFLGGEHYETLESGGDPSNYFVPNGVILVAYKPNEEVMPPIGDSAEHQLNASEIPPTEWSMVNGWPEGKTIDLSGGRFNILLFGGQFVYQEGHPQEGEIAPVNHPEANFVGPYPEDVFAKLFTNDAEGDLTFDPLQYVQFPGSVDISPYAD